MDPDQTAPSLLVYEASNILVDVKKKTHFVIMRLRVNKCEFSVYMVKIFMKCTHVYAAVY